MAKPLTKSQRIIRNRTNLEWSLLVALIIIAFLLFASLYAWWPYGNSDDSLGTAFYAKKRANSAAFLGGSLGGGDNGGSGSGTGSSGSGSGSGGGSGDSSSKSRLITFAAGVDTGNSKEQTDAEAGDLDESCAVLLNSSSIGKQEVCTYTEGDKLITITYLNDRVITASRSGF